MSRFFVTTPIFYVNAAPHLGHCHTLVLADALCRLQRLRNPQEPPLFTTGTDEHGIKIQQAARAAQLPEATFCESFSGKFRALCETMGTLNDSFVRTTDEHHKTFVTNLWETLKGKGHIYKGSYEGWYSNSDENFVTDIKEIEVKGKKVTVSADSGSPVEWIKEDNYMFRLASFKDDLLHWVNSEPHVVQPQKFHSLLKHSIEAGLEDLSVSRSRTRAHWGIPVPGDDSQTIYVWLDALSSYLSAAVQHSGSVEGCTPKVWPPTVQVIGKDILKFHGIYWPAFLMAAGLQLPRRILCHSHWTVDGEKMSKSRGNVVCPLDLVSSVQPDGLRYFLLREAVPHSDANFSEVKIKRILNAELANSLGNLLNRCTSASVNLSQTIPAFPDVNLPLTSPAQHLIEHALSLAGRVEPHFDAGNFHSGIDLVQEVLRQANVFVDGAKPWILAKTADQAEDTKHTLDLTLHTAFEVLRVVGTVLQPVVPRISANLLDVLGVRERNWDDASAWRRGSLPLGKKIPALFPRMK